MQGEGLIAELKHFIENDFENGRTSTSVAINDQTLHETELQAFEAGIDAGAGSIMCSYNRINAIYGCGNDPILHGILRDQLGFKGFVSMKAGPLSSLAVDPSTSCGRERALSCQAPGQVHWCEQGWPMTLDTPAACPARGRNGCHGPRAGRAGGAVLISLSPHRRRGPGVIGAAPVAQFH